MSQSYEPCIAKILEVIPETLDIKTFIVDNGKNMLIHKPGQFALLTPVFGEGEFAVSISSSALEEGTLKFSIKRAGRATEIMHRMEPGDEIGVRGPYGRPFLMDELEGKDLIFIAGGVGIAPLRSVINTVLRQRDRYKRIFILYGSRSAQDIVYKNELFNVWPACKDTVVAYTVDTASPQWSGTVGFVPVLMDKVEFPLDNAKVLTCGPSVMIKFVLDKLKKKGYSSKDIITTLEMKMQCGVGICGRCNIGCKYVCQDGPVFTLEELEGLPKEY